MLMTSIQEHDQLLQNLQKAVRLVVTWLVKALVDFTLLTPKIVLVIDAPTVLTALSGPLILTASNEANPTTPVVTPLVTLALML